MNQSKSLFLHWGPGASSAVEREWFGTSLSIDWWDQPSAFSGQSDPFEAVVAAAEAKLRGAREPVSLFAHSFGGQIALELLKRHPDRIRSACFLGANEWSGRAFVNLSRFLIARGLGGPQLPGLLAALEKEYSFENLLGLLQVVSTVPDFMAHYWADPSGEAAARYFEIAAKLGPLNLEAFGRIMSAWLSRPRDSAPVRYAGPVRIFLGERDPLIRFAEESQCWRARFPHAKIEGVPCGHFVHLETPASFWFGQ